jgi:hypothetical protein
VIVVNTLDRLKAICDGDDSCAICEAIGLIEKLKAENTQLKKDIKGWEEDCLV